MAHVTIVSGCRVHGDEPMSSESRAAIEGVIEATRRKVTMPALSLDQWAYLLNLWVRNRIDRKPYFGPAFVSFHVTRF